MASRSIKGMEIVKEYVPVYIALVIYKRGVAVFDAGFIILCLINFREYTVFFFFRLYITLLYTYTCARELCQTKKSI